LRKIVDEEKRKKRDAEKELGRVTEQAREEVQGLKSDNRKAYDIIKRQTKNI